MSSNPVKTLAKLACAAIALAPLLGCATAQKQAEREHAAKRAISHFNLAADHAANDRLEYALRDLLTAERLDPRNARVQHGLGIAYLQRGKVEEAERHMLRAVEIRPEYQQARYNLSTLYLNLERYDDCIEQSAVLVDDPTFPAPWRALNNWGWSLYRQGQMPEARIKLERAFEFSPGYWPTLMNLGILEAEQGQQPEAIRHFGRVLELEPGPSATAEANYRLAEIYVSLGRRQRAVGHLRTAVVKAPKDPWGRKSEEYLKLLR